MRHTHGDVGGDAPLTHWRVVRQLELFGHHAMDAVHIQPLSEQVSSWILTHTSDIRQQNFSKHHVGTPEFTTHSDDEVHGAAVGFPVRFDGHHSDPDHLTRAVVGFVHLNEGGEAIEVQVQLRLVGENLNAIHVTSDAQDVRTSVAGVTLVDLRWTTLDSLSVRVVSRNIWMLLFEILLVLVLVYSLVAESTVGWCL